MAIRTVVTRGYGNGTFNGTIPLVVTRGYALGVVAAPAPAVITEIPIAPWVPWFPVRIPLKLTVGLTIETLLEADMTICMPMAAGLVAMTGFRAAAYLRLAMACQVTSESVCAAQLSFAYTWLDELEGLAELGELEPAFIREIVCRGLDKTFQK